MLEHYLPNTLLLQPTTGRSRFGSRGKIQTTTVDHSESTTATSISKPGSRPRPNFNLRRRGPTTAEPSEGNPEGSQEEGSTTAKPIRGKSKILKSNTRTNFNFCQYLGRVTGNLARPLRPGPKINIAARGRPGQVTTTTTAATIEQESPSGDSQEEKVIQVII